MLGSPVTAVERGLVSLPTRDALLPALTLMVAAARESKPLSALVAGLPERYTYSDRVKNFPTKQSQSLLVRWQSDLPAMQVALGLDCQIIRVDTTDGLRVTLDNGDIVHLRPSGNAPELRCYAESDSENRASELVFHVLYKLECCAKHDH